MLVTFNANALPPEGASRKPPITATVGFSLTNLYDISLNQKSFKFTGYLWWRVNPITSTYVPYTRTDVINAKSYSIKPHYIVDAKPEYFEAKLSANISQEWQLRQFPFDTQDLQIQLEDNGYDASRLIYKVDLVNSRVNPNLILDDWQVIGFSMTPRIVFDYSQVDIHIKIERINSGWLFFYLFIGTFVGALLCILGFFLRANSDFRFNLFLGAIFAVVTNQHILYQLLPRTSYLTLTDKIQIATFVLLIFTAISYVILVKLVGKQRKKLAEYLNIRIGIVLFLSYLAAIIYIVYTAI